ncbi:hypothetical protein J6590_009282 [Homalodisca vitripennis]|nr:hypothetical protein J6590_009282 [Homalodisca vitripennis]
MSDNERMLSLNGMLGSDIKAQSTRLKCRANKLQIPCGVDASTSPSINLDGVTSVLLRLLTWLQKILGGHNYVDVTKIWISSEFGLWRVLHPEGESLLIAGYRRDVAQYKSETIQHITQQASEHKPQDGIIKSVTYVYLLFNDYRCEHKFSNQGRDYVIENVNYSLSRYGHARDIRPQHKTGPKTYPLPRQEIEQCLPPKGEVR